MRRLLAKMFDAEEHDHGWDLKLWPIGRLAFARKRDGAHSLELYKFARYCYVFEWWHAH